MKKRVKIVKIVVQRVKSSSVTINNEVYSKINSGLMLLFGVEKNDTEDFLDFMVHKILNLRIFNDENGKMNLSIKDIQGEILVVSQFTLAGDCKKGLRPSFDNAMQPDIANEYYGKFVSKLKESNLKIETGVFGADMKVELINDGPVTFILEKKNDSIK